MSTSVGVETFTLTQAGGVHFLDPIQVFLVVFHAIHAVEGERAEQRVAGHRLAHAGDSGSVLIASRCPPARLGACAYLNSTMRTRWMVSSRTPKAPWPLA